MNAPSVDIKDLLIGITSLSLVFKTNLFIGLEQDEPDECATIFDTPGGRPDLTLDRLEIYETPTIQIRVRSRSYLNGITLMSKIYTELHGRGPAIINQTTYTAIIAMQNPFLLDFDLKGRPRFVCNFELQRTP